MYVKAKTIAPKYIGLWLGLESVYLHSRNFEKAIHCCEIASILNPNYFIVWHIRAIIPGSISDYDRAILCYAKCLELNPRNIAALHDKTFIHLYLDDINKLTFALIIYSS